MLYYYSSKFFTDTPGFGAQDYQDLEKLIISTGQAFGFLDGGVSFNLDLNLADMVPALVFRNEMCSIIEDDQIFVDNEEDNEDDLLVVILTNFIPF